MGALSTLQERVGSTWNTAKTEVESLRVKVQARLHAIREVVSKRSLLQGRLDTLHAGAQGQQATGSYYAQAMCSAAKRMLAADSVAERAAKRIRRRMPQMPEDVVPLVLEHVSVSDMCNSPLVCCTWQRAVDANAVGLLESRCKKLGLLPPQGTSTNYVCAPNCCKHVCNNSGSSCREHGSKQNIADDL